LVVWERRYGRINYVVELVGRLDQTTSEQLDAALERALEASARRILLDLRSLSGMDLWGLDPILLAHLRASDQHVQFLIAASPTVKHVLDSICAPFDYV
jgi:anti-anti-sigma factor